MSNPNKLPVLEIFGPTIQGEGAMIGVQTTFIRTVHCDYACHMCDSMHAVDPAQYKGKETVYTARGLLDRLLDIQGNCEWITISGGNPALWDFSEFVVLAHEADLCVAVETQGSVYKPWLVAVDQLTVSPKGPGMVNDPGQSLSDYIEFIQHISAEGVDPSLINVKVPVFNETDLEFAETIKAINPDADLFLSIGNNLLPGPDGIISLRTHREHLLDAMELMYLEISKRPGLANAIVLPQLHVLLWGNRQLV